MSQSGAGTIHPASCWLGKNKEWYYGDRTAAAGFVWDVDWFNYDARQYFATLGAPATLTQGGKTYYFDHIEIEGAEFPNFDGTKQYQVSDPYEVADGSLYWNVYYRENEDPEDPDEYFKIVAKATPSLGGTATGGGIYKKGTPIVINVTEKDGWKFLYWENSTGEKVYTKSHGFFVTKNDVWVAWMEERKDTHLIVRRAEGQGDVGSICYLYDKILRDEH